MNDFNISMPRFSLPGASGYLLAGALFVLAGFRLITSGQFNLLVSLLIGVLFIGLLSLSRHAAIYAVFAYLFLVGDLRRMDGWLVGFPKLDPLLIIGPGVTLVIVLPLFIRLKLVTAIEKWMLAFMAVNFVEIFNPRQGGITVGLTGVMFHVVPILWFWIGTRYGTDEIVDRILFRVVVPLSVAAAFLGFYQTFVGFLPWEQLWIDNVSSVYAALYVSGGNVRAFGFSVNSIEYADLLMVSSAVCIAAAFTGRRKYLLLLPILLPALFLESSRSPIVKIVFATSAAWALSRKGHGWLFRLAAALAVITGLGVLALNHVDVGSRDRDSAAQASIKHQVNGLLHPGDSKYSTAGLHSQMFLGGLLEGFKSPLGNGLGAGTLGANKFSDTPIGSTEVDISDAFVTLGAVGGLIYLWLIVLILRVVMKSVRSNPGGLLPVFSLLIAMVGAWIASGQYGIAPLIWFIIGALTRRSAGGLQGISVGTLNAAALVDRHEPAQAF
jgi:hypothetical protein